MTEFAETLLAQLRPATIAGFIVFLRIGAAMALLPGFGEAMVPTRIKLAAAIAFTAVVTPAVSPAIAPLTGNPVALLASFASETLIGLAMGLVLRLMVMALEMAGTVAAQTTSLSQLFGAGGEPMPAMSHLLVMAGIALAMVVGLHTKVAAFFILSYDALPAGQIPDAGTVRGWGVVRIAQAFAFAFSLAAPFVLASTVYNVALGAINRAMPQLMVSFVGAPALTAGSLVLLAIAAPTALALWLGSLDANLSDPFGVPR